MKHNNTLTHIKAIMGLGNPGVRYYNTRHSIGYRIVDALIAATGGSWRDRGLIQVADILIHDRPITVIKSNTYMNDSGKAIPYLLKKGIATSELLVIHDELEKPWGSWSVKIGGSHRGHNGLRSIIDVCGDNFYRLRVGIGRPEHKDEVPDYVLAPFSCAPTEVDTIINEIVEFLLQSL